MLSRIRRAFLAAVVGGLAAALGLVAAYALHPGLVYEMNHTELPSFIKGIYGSERNALGTYAWTGRVVTIDLPGLDRQEVWHCTLRFRGADEAGRRNPTVTVSVDSVPGRPIPATNEYQELGINLPANPSQAGASIVIIVAPTFVGRDDPRELGVQVDRFLCRPDSALVRPPGNTLTYATLSAAIFSAGLALLGLSLSSAMFAAVMIGLGQTVLLALGSGMYGNYASRLPWLALIIIAAAIGVSRTIHILRREALSSTARFVVAGSASVLFLKLAGLMHPAKHLVDATFNAHRLERVLAGDFWFTQPLPNGVEMPYAIGLYIFAAPWTLLTSDYVTLLRAVTASADVISGALLYPVMLRAWGDRRAASLAAVLFQLVPHPFTTLGSANLPNMFGQSMGLAAIAAAVTWPLDFRKWLPAIGLLALITWAFCTHVSTITMLSAMLGVLVVVEFIRRDPARRRSALVIAAVTIAALVLSWLLYYSHWIDVFRAAFTTMFSDSGAVSGTAPNAAVLLKGNMTMPERVWNWGAQTVFSFGWPLLLLSAIGVWSLMRNRTHDRLTSALIAWAAMWVVLSASTVFARVDAAYVRYAAEFLGRINLATVPLIAVLAGRGAAAGWDPTTSEVVRKPLQYVAAILMAWTLVVAAQTWLGWFLS